MVQSVDTTGVQQHKIEVVFCYCPLKFNARDTALGRGRYMTWLVGLVPHTVVGGGTWCALINNTLLADEPHVTKAAECLAVFLESSASLHKDLMGSKVGKLDQMGKCVLFGIFHPYAELLTGEGRMFLKES